MIKKIKDYLDSVRQEMKKVTWPTKDELKESTWVVIVVCALLAGFTYLIDIALTQILQGIF